MSNYFHKFQKTTFTPLFATLVIALLANEGLTQGSSFALRTGASLTDLPPQCAKHISNYEALLKNSIKGSHFIQACIRIQKQFEHLQEKITREFGTITEFIEDSDSPKIANDSELSRFSKNLDIFLNFFSAIEDDLELDQALLNFGKTCPRDSRKSFNFIWQYLLECQSMVKVEELMGVPQEQMHVLGFHKNREDQAKKQRFLRRRKIRNRGRDRSVNIKISERP